MIVTIAKACLNIINAPLSKTMTAFRRVFMYYVKSLSDCFFRLRLTPSHGRPLHGIERCSAPFSALYNIRIFLNLKEKSVSIRRQEALRKCDAGEEKS